MSRTDLNKKVVTVINSINYVQQDEGRFYFVMELPKRIKSSKMANDYTNWFMEWLLGHYDEDREKK